MSIKNLKNKNVGIITGIPRSGTSLVASIISFSDNVAVLNEPAQLTKILKNNKNLNDFVSYINHIKKTIIQREPIYNKQSNGFITENTALDDTRRPHVFDVFDLSFNLIIKNTLGFLFAIERIINAIPEIKIIFCFRNPFETIASWKNSFNHLKKAMPNKIAVINDQISWLNDSDNKQINLINNEQTDTIRRAQLWTFLANRIIELSGNGLLVNYSNLINNPQIEINRITDYLNICKSSFQTRQIQHKSKKYELNAFEYELIDEYCMNTYERLCEIY